MKFGASDYITVFLMNMQIHISIKTKIPQIRIKIPKQKLKIRAFETQRCNFKDFSKTNSITLGLELALDLLILYLHVGPLSYTHVSVSKDDFLNTYI